MVSLTAAFRMNLREEKLEARDSGWVPGDRNLRQNGKESECGLSRGTPTVDSILGYVQEKMDMTVRSLEIIGRS